MSVVLVLGASGTIGLEVAIGLVKKGYKVYGLTRKQENAEILTRNEVIPIVSDAKNVGNWVPFALKSDIVIDAISDYADKTTPFKIQQALVNVHKERPNIRFIYTSGCLVYGDNQDTVNELSKYTEHPISKWRLDIENEYTKIGGTVIQPGFVYGKNHSYAGFLFEAVTKPKSANGADNAVIKLWGNDNLNPDQYMSFIHIFDLVEFYFLVVKNSISLKGQVLIANSYNEKVQDVVKSIARVAKVQIKSIELVKPKLESLFAQALAFNQKLSYSKASLLIGYHPSQPSLTDDTERYYNSWLLLNENNPLSSFNKSILPE